MGIPKRSSKPILGFFNIGDGYPGNLRALWRIAEDSGIALHYVRIEHPLSR